MQEAVGYLPKLVGASDVADRLEAEEKVRLFRRSPTPRGIGCSSASCDTHTLWEPGREGESWTTFWRPSGETGDETVAIPRGETAP